MMANTAPHWFVRTYQAYLYYYYVLINARRYLLSDLPSNPIYVKK